VKWLGITAGKFYSSRERYGRVNEHNGCVPRDFWLEEWEREAICEFHQQNPLGGYRGLSFMMLDRDIVAASPSSVWPVLSQAGLLRNRQGPPSRTGTGFEQPPAPHQHWHIDVSYINPRGTFYCLCSVPDGYSRSIGHWDLREADIEIILEAAAGAPGERQGGATGQLPMLLARSPVLFGAVAGSAARAVAAQLRTNGAPLCRGLRAGEIGRERALPSKPATRSCGN